MYYRLKDLRKKVNLTQQQLCDELGIKLGTYRNYEQGIRELDGEQLSRFADYYNVTTDYILNRTDPILHFSESTTVYDYQLNISSVESDLIRLWRSASAEGQKAAMVVLEAHSLPMQSPRAGAG